MKRRLVALICALFTAMSLCSCDADPEEIVAFAHELGRRVNEKLSQLTPELVAS